jgi:hypothetical protein
MPSSKCGARGCMVHAQHLHMFAAAALAKYCFVITMMLHVYLGVVVFEPGAPTRPPLYCAATTVQHCDSVTSPTGNQQG